MITVNPAIQGDNIEITYPTPFMRVTKTNGGIQSGVQEIMQQMGLVDDDTPQSATSTTISVADYFALAPDQRPTVTYTRFRGNPHKIQGITRDEYFPDLYHLKRLDCGVYANGSDVLEIVSDPKPVKTPFNPPFTTNAARQKNHLTTTAFYDLFALTMQLRAFCNKYELDYDLHLRDMVHCASDGNLQGLASSWQRLTEAESTVLAKSIETFMNQALETE